MNKKHKVAVGVVSGLLVLGLTAAGVSAMTPATAKSKTTQVRISLPHSIKSQKDLAQKLAVLVKKRQAQEAANKADNSRIDVAYATSRSATRKDAATIQATKPTAATVQTTKPTVSASDVVTNSIQAPRAQTSPAGNANQTTPAGNVIQTSPEKIVSSAAQNKATPVSNTAAVSHPAYNLTANEMDMLARLVQAEAGAEIYQGKVAVAAVVLNRLRSPLFPKTVKDIIYDPWQFESVDNGWFYKPASAEAYRAAQDAANGNDPTHGALYFWNANTSNPFLWSKPYIKIGNQYFA